MRSLAILMLFLAVPAFGDGEIQPPSNECFYTCESYKFAYNGVWGQKCTLAGINSNPDCANNVYYMPYTLDGDTYGCGVTYAWPTGGYSEAFTVPCGVMWKAGAEPPRPIRLEIILPTTGTSKSVWSKVKELYR